MTVGACTKGERLTLSGLVQGVGFRPLVWRLAQRWRLAGQVRNTSAGVQIDLWGPAKHRQQFIDNLYQQLPPLAQIDRLQRRPLAGQAATHDFVIAPSAAGAVSAAVVADAASCPQCVSEIFDPANRRHGYAFTHCCHCGPRLSIVKAIPYDRHNTSMADFPLCARCQQEYDDPADRRFHAQPTACGDCGPQLLWLNAGGESVDTSNPIVAAAAALRRGAMVAIKGLGGIQLACDARNRTAIASIRRFKQRPHKALALMARDLDSVRRYAQVTGAEAGLLTGPEAPIVILPAAGETLPELLAPGQNSLGFMLPYTPLHHLLLAELDFPLVLTSANCSGSPQIIDNAVALRELSGLAGGFLLHDRDIINRVDDSVIRLMAGAPRMLRRARGYAPSPLPLPPGFEQAPPLLAMGGQKKNSFCLLHFGPQQQGQAVVSQYIGELDNPDSCRDYRHYIELYRKLYDHRPELIAIDQHPNYFSSQQGRALARERGVDVEPVQHHHAHVAAVMLEHGLPIDHKPVLGIALDGLGLGDNGELWGGEFLLCDYRRSHRVASLAAVAMPGGDRASHEPWRNLLAQLLAIQPWGQWQQQYPELEVINYLQQQPVEQLEQLIAGNINSPVTSSAGRLFDAVAVALGLCSNRQSYEGQAAIELEALAQLAWSQTDDERYKCPIIQQSELWRLDWTHLWPALLGDLVAGIAREQIAARFHRSLIQGLCNMVQHLADQNAFDQVVLSGGAMQNKLLFEGVVEELARMAFSVITPVEYPANDGGLSLGQAAVAAARSVSSSIDQYRPILR